MQAEQTRIHPYRIGERVVVVLATAGTVGTEGVIIELDDELVCLDVEGRSLWVHAMAIAPVAGR